MTFFSGRDTNMDVTRSYLMMGMIVAHVFFWFYRSYFNYHLTFHLTIGFVFISAFTMTVVSTRRLAANRAAAGRHLAIRGVKLVLIFLVGNLAVLALLPQRMQFVRSLTPAELLGAVLLNTRDDTFSFDILVPIGLFFMTMWAMIPASRPRAVPPLALAGLVVLLAICESRDLLNYFGFKQYLVACIGCMAGLMADRTDWPRVAAELSRRAAVLAPGAGLVALYFLGIALKARGTVYHVSYHVVPLIVLLLVVYLFAYRAELGRWKIVDLLNRVLSGHMLFVYLFHLVLLNLLRYFIPMRSLDLGRILLVVLSVLVVTMAATLTVDSARRRWQACDRLYNLVFK